MENEEMKAQAEGIIARAKAILLNPAAEWDKIAGEQDAPMQVFLRYAVPLAAIGPIASLIGGQLFGYGAFGITYKPDLMPALGTAISSYVLSLVMIWVVAWLANFLAPKFGGKENWPGAFKLVVYSMTAGWLAGIFGILPALGILGLLGLYGIYLFYKGATPMVAVPADKAAGYTAVTVIAMIVLSLIAGAITAALTAPAAMMGSGMSARDADSDTVFDMGELGRVTVDEDKQTVDMGEMGRIVIDEDGGKATITIDGQEMTIDVPKEASE